MHHTIWQGVCSRLRERLGQVGFETWISPLNFVGIEGRTATLQAPNKFFRDWVNDRYLNDLRQSLCAETGTDVEIKLLALLQDHKEAAVNQQQAMPPPPRCQTISPASAGRGKLNPHYTFDAFVVGASNQFAHAAAKAVATEPGRKYNPLFLYGGVGLGKTHLATAIGHQLSNSDRERQVIFAPAELFMNEFISSLRHDRMSAFKETMRQVDVLILDDVHFLAGRERVQEEFLHTFNSLQAQRHQIILTSDKSPRDLAGLEERLRSRFESGLIADIAPPDLKTRIAILQKKAAEENLTLEPEAAMFVARMASSNVRELEGCVNRLAALAALTKSPITVDFARKSLRDLIREEDAKLDVADIQRHVSEVFHIPLLELKSNKRTQHLVFCRQLAMYLCRMLTDSSFPAIGAEFRRDHSTVIHAYNVIARRVNSDGAFRASIQKLERQLKSSSFEPSHPHPAAQTSVAPLQG